MQIQPNILIPVILSGGAGSRLWPVSREQNPKPFIRPMNGQSLLQGAYLRGMNLDSVKSVITVTNSHFLHRTQEEFAELEVADAFVSYILEPFGRNTAPAITAAAIQALSEHGSDAVLLVLAADHLITKADAFQNAVSQAIELAKQGKLVTFGIQPHAPETGYGYIEAEGNKVIRFVEKPSHDSAKEYLKSGKFLWNSGIFCFKATTLLAELALHYPAVLASIQKCICHAKVEKTVSSNQLWIDADDFNQVPNISIDYAVMEKSSQIAVVPCDIGWSDIGSWLALADLQLADENGNQIQGDIFTHDTQNCIIQSTDRLLCSVGIDNLIIIDTPDALLVANKKNAQDVKHIYAKLKAESHDCYKLHRTVHRPWGIYTVLEEGNQFKIKRIEVKPGASLSLQKHQHRSEHWIIVNGMAKVVNGEHEMLLNTNESTYISAGQKHRLENPGPHMLVMIEVQCGEYLGEDDIVRFEDIYGRS